MPSYATTRADLDLMGFAVIEGAFSAEEVAEVKAMLDDLLTTMTRDVQHGRSHRYIEDMAPDGRTGDHPSGPAPTSQWRQPELRYPATFAPALLDTRVFRTCQDIARALAGPVSRSFDHVICKPAHNDLATEWHQDSAYRRLSLQQMQTNLHFWIPLQDATVENGCMRYVRTRDRTPLPHAPFARSSGRIGLAAAPVDPETVVTCPVACGGLTVHTPLTLHSAGPNHSAMPRTAWIIQFARFGRLQLALRELLGHAPRRGRP